MPDSASLAIKSVRLFRIEHPDDRRGPFERFIDGADIEAMGDFLSLCAAGAANPTDEQSAAVHPDGVRGPTSAWRYACRSLDELSAYFGSSVRDLFYAYGYVIGEYLVPVGDSILGNGQAVFQASAAWHITDHPVSTAFLAPTETQPEPYGLVLDDAALVDAV